MNSLLSILQSEVEETRQDCFQDVVVALDQELIIDWHAEGKDRCNFIFSCTKSILSLCFGIFLDEHKIISIKDSIQNHLPVLDRKYENITIENLLSMTSGISWSDMKHGNYDYNKMVKGDWLEYVLSKPVLEDSIGRFNYSDANSLLLSTIITKYTKLPLSKFAEEYLFLKLGINNVKWKEQNGITMGGTGLHMKSVDLTKIGMLMLNKGMYNNEQIVSEDWIVKSTSKYSNGHPEWFGNYGLHWWVSSKKINNKIDMFFALGAHGQFLFVIPETRLVVCVRKKVGKIKDMNRPMVFLFDNILPKFA